MTTSIPKVLAVALLLVLGTSTTGCDFEEVSGPFEGAQVAFSQRGNAFARTVTDSAGTVQVPVELIAAQRASDTTFPVTVAGTAVEGTHYTLPGGSEVVIPANSSFGQFTINVLDGNIPAGESRTIVLEVQDSVDGQVTAAENWDTFTVSIAGD